MTRAEDIAGDVSYGVRVLRKNPGFASVAIVTLALGIGACTAIFSLVRGVLLRPAPYGTPERLVYIWTPNDNFSQVPPNAIGPAGADFYDIRRDSRSFSSLALFDTTDLNLTVGDATERIGGARVSGNFFSTLDVHPVLGRSLEPQDDQPGRPRVVVISHRLWQAAFKGVPDVLRKTLTLNREVYQIVAVMPPRFRYPQRQDLIEGEVADGTDAWLPLALTAAERSDRGISDHVAIGRLLPGVSVARAQAELGALMVRLDLQRPPADRGWHVRVVSLVDSSIGDVRRPLWLLFGAVSLVLLIACSNAAHLLLARASGRAREMSIRCALGAARSRLVRQVLTEALLLALGGGALGVLLAHGAVRTLVRLNPGNIPRLEEVSLDGGVLLFSVSVSVLTGLVFGLIPALWASRANVGDVLKRSAHAQVTVAGTRVRQALIVAEVALAVVLLAGAGLLLRSSVRVQRLDPGFSMSTLTLRVSLDSRYPELAIRRRFYRDLLTRIARLPGVQAAGAVDALPLSHSERLTGFEVDGVPSSDQFINARAVSEAYFDAMGTKVVEGRAFAADDADGRTPVVVVNQAFAARFFPGRTALGKRFRFHGQEGGPVAWSRIVGVVANVRHSNLEDAVPPQVYESLWQSDADGVYVAVRTAGSTAPIVSGVRRTLQAVDPMLPVTNIGVMSERVAEVTSRRRFQTFLVIGFSAVALVLAAVGLYGLLATLVKDRSREIGIRIALGASSRDVFGMIVGRGMGLTAAGMALGVAGALLLTRLLAGLLYGVSPTDPGAFLSVVLVLTGTALAACYVPAARAIRVDPAMVLRDE